MLGKFEDKEEEGAGWRKEAEFIGMTSLTQWTSGQLLRVMDL